MVYLILNEFSINKYFLMFFRIFRKKEKFSTVCIFLFIT